MTSVPVLNDIQAKFYLEKYPDLRTALGNNLEKAKLHWIKRGFKEKRVIRMLDTADCKKYKQRYKQD